jgi:hypothetical protein
LISKPKLRVVVQIPCDEPDNEQIRNITRHFQAMYENLWREDVRFRYPGTPSDEAFFRLYTSPSDLDASGFLMGTFSREQGLNGFAATLERYARPGQMPEIETLSAHRFVLDGDVGPLVDGDGDDGDSSDGSTGGSSDDDSSGSNSSSDESSSDYEDD